MKLSVLVPRPSDGQTLHRLLTSLDGSAQQICPLLVPNTSTAELDRHLANLKVEGLRAGIAVTAMSVFEDEYPGPADFSEVVNNMMRATTADYVLVMNPGEVCLDPENVGRTLAYLDGQPQIEVVSCPVKIYDQGAHVRDVMRPKFIRRGKVHMTGLHAEDWEPYHDVNWLMNASGMAFLDHGDAAPYSMEELDNFVDLNAYAHEQDGVEPPRARLVRIGRACRKTDPELAEKVLRKIVDGEAPTPNTIPAMVTLARVLWATRRHEEARTLLDESIAILPTVEALLVRGQFYKTESILTDDGKATANESMAELARKDFAAAVDLAKKSSTYGLDLRELEMARFIVENA